MARIFISYRREDASGHAGRLYDQLAEHFGEEQLFIDVDALEPGVDFVERIESAVGSADVLVAVIGPRWLDAKGPDGARRLDDPDDFVGLEIAAALERDIRVVPVLVAGAVMPDDDHLPGRLKPLSRRNALVVSDLDWRSGMSRLVAAIDSALGHEHVEVVEEEEEEEPRREEGGGGAALGVLGAAGALALAAGTFLRRDVFLSPDFGPLGTVPLLPAVTSPAPLGVALGAVAALALVHARPRSALAAGLLLGTALAGLAKYGALLGSLAAAESRDAWIAGNGSPASILLALAGSALLAGVAVAHARRRPEPGGRLPPATRLLALGGAVLTVLATLVPFNVVFPGSARAADRVVAALPPSPWEAVDPIALAAIAVVAALAASDSRRLLAAGVLAAAGALALLLWLRYVGVPVLQMLFAEQRIASVRLGGFLGLAGGALVLAGGLLAARSAPERAPGSVPSHGA